MAILIEPTETKKTVVKCDGGGGPLGHPAVYLNLGQEGRVVCPYCSRDFIKAPDKNYTPPPSANKAP